MARRRPTETAANPARGAALVVAAVVIGLVLLRNGLDTSETFTPSTTDGSTEGTDEATDGGTTVDDGTDNTVGTTVRPPDQVATIVLNDSGVTGAAGRYSDHLAGLGYNLTNPAGDDSSRTGNAATTEVLYQPGFEAEAAAVATAIGAPATSVKLLGATLPGSVAGANVVVVIGTDLANTDPPAAAGATTAGATTDG